MLRQYHGAFLGTERNHQQSSLWDYSAIALTCSKSLIGAYAQNQQGSHNFGFTHPYEW